MKKILSLTIISVFIMSGTVFSQMNSGRSHGKSDFSKMPYGKWWRVPAIQEDLGVTSAEQKKLDQLFNDSRRRMIDLKGSIEKEKLNLEDIMDNEKFDKAECLKTFQALQVAKTKLATERFSFIVEIRELFGQERYLKLSNKRKEIRRHCLNKNISKCPASGEKKRCKMKKKEKGEKYNN